MKRLIAWLVSPPLYGVGHVLSQFLRWNWGCFMYGAYNRLMIWSSDIEEWAGVEIMWRSPEEGA